MWPRAEHFERMSKHVTFVAHDLKNVISQLSLVLQQAKDHAHDPAFVSDTFLTIGDAVERMKRLMQRVQEGAAPAPLQTVDLSALVKTGAKGAAASTISPTLPTISASKPKPHRCSGPCSITSSTTPGRLASRRLAVGADRKSC